MRLFIATLSIFAVLLLFQPHPVFAATIAFDASSSGNNNNASNSLTFSHTVTGSNPTLVCLGWRNGNIEDGMAMTYNGVSMTKIDGLVNSANNNFLDSFILIGPATGTHNVVLSSNTNPSNLHSVCMSYTGTAQSGQPDAHGTKTGTASPSTLTITTVTDNDWVISVGGGAGNPLTASTGVTQRVSDGANENGGDSNGVVHPAGTYSTSWTTTGGVSITQLDIAIAPFTVAPVTIQPAFNEIYSWF